MTGRKWVRLSLSQLSRAMGEVDHRVSPTTISRLLDQSHYALRANMKSKEPGSDHPERNTQFEYIAQKQQEFREAGLPIISIDTKKRN